MQYQLVNIFAKCLALVLLWYYIVIHVQTNLALSEEDDMKFATLQTAQGKLVSLVNTESQQYWPLQDLVLGSLVT
jgi:hypothetical protein